MRGDRKVLTAALAVAALALLSGAGFRNDSGLFPTAKTPTFASPRWKVPISTWSNASPIVVGELVCTNTEPTRLSCVDRTTGQQRWSATNDVLDALDANARAAIGSKLQEVIGQAATLPTLIAEQGRMRRDLRAGGDPSLVARVGALSQQIQSIHEQQVAYAPYLTPADRESAGWSMPTPWTDGRSLWALYGNGVVSRFEQDGRRAWSVWLGPAQPAFRGWTLAAGPTTTASPRVVDGVLVVPHGQLRGLDPATGVTRWTGGPYTDFAAPAVAQVGGVAVLVTPDGQAIRAKDGRVLATRLGDVYFVAPTTHGDRVWFVGGSTNAHDDQFGSLARALRLVSTGPDSLRADVLWEATLPEKSRIFAQPLYADGRIWIVQDNGVVTVLDADTGALLSRLQLDSMAALGFYSSPVAAAGAIWFGDQGGVLHELRGTNTLADTPHTIEGMRATPMFDAERLYLRTFSALWAFGP